MEDILKYLIKSSDENFANQIEYILKQLAREDADDGSDEESDEDAEEDDDNDELGMLTASLSPLSLFLTSSTVGDEEEAPEILLSDAQPSGEVCNPSPILPSSP